MSGVLMLYFLTDWLEFSQIHQYYTMALINQTILKALLHNISSVKIWDVLCVSFVTLYAISVSDQW